MATFFALPIASASLGGSVEASSKKKRKRRSAQDDGQDSENDQPTSGTRFRRKYKAADGHDRDLPANLRRQHLCALTAVLHRCLSDKDWARAERAFGLLLREQVKGLDIDLRNGDLWGIGAEMLLRRGTWLEQSPNAASSTRRNNTGNETTDSGVSPFSQQALAKAKRYYETLIVQHPPNKRYPEFTNALDFYHAMFGLRIYIAQYQAKQKLEAAHEEDDEENDPSSLFPTVEPKLLALEQAQRISNDLAAVMTTFPYRDDHGLVQMQAMVLLWFADVLEECGRLAEDIKKDIGIETEDATELEDTIRRIASDLITPDEGKAGNWKDGRLDLERLRSQARGLLKGSLTQAADEGP